MTKPQADGVARRGRIDDVEDLSTLDLVEFNDGVDPLRSQMVKRAWTSRAQYYRRLVEKWGFVDRGDIADVGAGYGRWSLFLAEVNPSVRAYERIAGQVELGRKLAARFDFPNATFETADVAALPAADNSFDGVWCYNVVHSVNRGKALPEMHRILKPGALLLVGAYNGLGRVLERFFENYAAGGLANPKARMALQSLKQGPMFHDSKGTYGTEAEIESVLGEFGFALSPEYPFEMRMSPQAQPTDVFAKELRDLPALAERVESDPDFAEAFAAHPEVAYLFPMDVTVGATKV
jgi:SAM-dependent methyltransferase